MSHFTCLVTLSPKFLAEHRTVTLEQAVAAAMAPYHEFECTRQDDQYVVDVDCTAEMQKSYAEDKIRRLRSPSGELKDPYDNEFYRDPTAEELAVIRTTAGSGAGRNLSWTSQDWGDGLGHRAKVRYVPDGWEDVEINSSTLMPFREYVASETEREEVTTQPGRPYPKELMYGYTLLDENGNVVKTVRRTNPNAFWDYWRIGGRWRGTLTVKPEAIANNAAGLGPLAWEFKSGYGTYTAEANAADVCLRKDLDLEAVDARALSAMERWWLTFDSVRRGQADPGDSFSVQGFAYDIGLRDIAAEDAARAAGERKAIYRDITREQFLSEFQWAWGISAYALNQDGVWSAPGRMGWFGCSTDTPEQRKAFRLQLRQMIESLDPDTVIACTDCHI